MASSLGKPASEGRQDRGTPKTQLRIDLGTSALSLYRVLGPTGRWCVGGEPNKQWAGQLKLTGALRVVKVHRNTLFK